MARTNVVMKVFFMTTNAINVLRDRKKTLMAIAFHAKMITGGIKHVMIALRIIGILVLRIRRRLAMSALKRNSTNIKANAINVLKINHILLTVHATNVLIINRTGMTKNAINPLKMMKKNVR